MPNKNDDDSTSLLRLKKPSEKLEKRLVALDYANPNPSVPIVIAVNNAERSCSYDSYSGKSIWLKQV